MNKTAWLISLMPPLMSLVIIRTYLGSFDNASLFTENLSGSGIFNFVFIFMMLTLAAFAVIFFLPSLIFSISVPERIPKLHNYSDIKIKITLSAILSIPLTVFWLFAWTSASVIYPDHETLTGWTCLLGGLMSVFLINFLCLRKPVSIAQEYQSSKLRIKTALMLYATSPALLLVVIALYFLFGFNTVLNWIDQNTAGYDIATILKEFVLIAVLGMFLLFPGAMYVVTESTVRNSVWFIRFGLITIILCPILTCIYIPSFYPVLVDKTMELSGISDWKPRLFQIDETKISFSHFANEEWKRVRINGEKRFIVKGIMVYSLNNVKLLCPESIEELYRNTLHFVPWDRDYDKEKAAELKKASARCQPFTHGGVIRLSE